MRRFKELRVPILNFLNEALSSNNLDNIQSLEINRRKPHTKRLFFYLGEERICLHDFEPCEEIDSFPHPHSWESEIMILSGSYIHSQVFDVDLSLNISDAFDDMCTLDVIAEGDSYHIDKPTTWHKVTPITKVSTVMINSPIWKKYNNFCKFTKGKELKAVSLEQKKEMVQRFINLLEDERIVAHK